MNRRKFLSALPAGASAATVLNIGRAEAASSRRTFVFVHGSWHGAWCFSKILARLSTKGLVAIARDLPGHGGLALHPKTYRTRPLDRSEFAKERSPLAGITLKDYVSDIGRSIDALVEAGSGPVILVGHSMGGLPITALGEAAPEKIAKLVYISAFMPASGVPAAAYMQSEEAKGGTLSLVMMADPGRVGALRIDPKSDDANYATALKTTFAEDVTDEEWNIVTSLLSPDDPAQPVGVPIELSAARWGSIPRVYIKCSRDSAIRPALQDSFIRAADKLTPRNKTIVRELDSDHSPFLSHSEELAEILSSLASD